MGILNSKEKEELKRLADSFELKEDLRAISKKRYNPFIVNGAIDLDRLLIFLNEYNDFINHTPKPLHRIIDKYNKL